ncbi:hypothetical protein ACIRVF_08075 [Kitasatospora sp. NPDC101157]|uniref:hypothetical protein n=1 Tax=Kitasatospora sp. NPDC101157 TaxID=3364098 RepID=UPI00380781FF
MSDPYAAVEMILSLIPEQHHDLAREYLRNHHPSAILQYASQFRLPLTNTVGGYGEITIQRGEDLYHDKWAVTDGAFSGCRAWTEADGWTAGSGWQYISDIGRANAYRYTLQEAFEVARRVVEIESACSEAEVAAIRARIGGQA